MNFFSSADLVVLGLGAVVQAGSLWYTISAIKSMRKQLLLQSDLLAAVSELKDTVAQTNKVLAALADRLQVS